MTEQLKQSLSAVVDGEADAFELRRVLDELERDAELRATWSRYHLIGSVIRGERTAAASAVARALERRLPVAIRADSSAVNAAPGCSSVSATETPAPASRTARALADSQDTTSTVVPDHPHGRRRAGIGFGAALALAAMAGLAIGVAVAPMDVDNLPRVAEIDTGPLVRIDQSTTDDARSDLRDNLLIQGDLGYPPASEVVGAAPEALSLAQQQRVRAYMLQHAQQQALDQRGVISLVKMATYQAP